jgi:hypothetical protein
MGTGLKKYSGDFSPEEGIAPFGIRHAGDSAKGRGYFGVLDTKRGPMTEFSSEDEKGEYPLVVPTLTKKELEKLKSEEVTPEIEDKARSWAETRRKVGKSPFAQPDELRLPAPKKKGGVIRTASKRADGIAKRGKTRGRML